MSKNMKIKIYETVILPVVLYGCEASFLILWEEGVCEQGAEENIWTKDRWSDGSLEKTT
jgi:hypothetical protein